ncbi:MAG: DUF4080 domain-containing protein [Eubacteriales bacterium]|nr:DUF4080 domain-containing protein [Eubacteriales bacterium]
MNTLIVALNSKFIHSALSVWYLKANASSPCYVMESTVNQPILSLYREILGYDCENIAFSCYIWNIDTVLRLAQIIKDARPNVKIILGGPEVSYDSEAILKEHPYIDYILCGEGEIAFEKLMYGDYTADGISYRTEDGVVVGSYQLVMNLDLIKSPYTDEMLDRIPYGSVYYEASRGCPFNCGYCLSSTFNGVRRFSFDRIKSDIKKIVDSGVSQIKFVDRTFNYDCDYTYIFLDWLKDNTGDVNLHFEIASDLLDDRIITLLGTFPLGKVQLEAGVQSMNPHTIEAVSRKTDLDKVLSNAKKIMDKGNIHLHLDLIAGLPYEGYESFKESFDTVYSIKPHTLQLGFLKLLKGSRVRSEAEHEFKFANFPPYEIICNKYLTPDEIIRLKKVEDMVDRFYNSGRFINSLDYLIKGSPFEFFEKLSCGMEFTTPPSQDALYEHLYKFADDENLMDILKLDFLCTTRNGRLPSFMDTTDLKEETFEYLKSAEPQCDARARYKQVRLEYFKSINSYILFDYSKQNPVTGQYEYREVNLKC